MNKIKDRIMGIVLLALSLLLALGVQLIFPACGPKEDGTFMTCHQSQQAVFAMSIALCCISAVSVIPSDGRIRLGAAISAVPTAVMAAVTPGILTGLCMMENMQCHTLMRPAVIVICVLIVIIAAIYAALLIKKNNGGKN